MKLRGKGDYIDPEWDRWAVKGLEALCTPLETDEARLKRFHEYMGSMKVSVETYAVSHCPRGKVSTQSRLIHNVPQKCKPIFLLLLPRGPSKIRA